MSPPALLAGAALALAVVAVSRLHDRSTPLERYLRGLERRRPAGTHDEKGPPLLERWSLLQGLGQAELRWSLVTGVGAGIAAAIGLGQLWLAPVVAALLAGGAPALLAARNRRKRVRDFSAQLEGTLLRMSSALRAGADLRAAILDLTGAPDPTGAEFREAARAMEVGLPPVRAVEEMYRRVPTPEMRLVVVATRIHAESGGDLAKNLETIASTIRERLITQAQVNAATAEARMEAGMVAVIAMAIPPAVYLFMPAFGAYWFQSPLRLGLGAVLYAASAAVYLWLRSLSRVEV